MTAPAPELSIVIVSRNAEADLQKCISSIYEHTRPLSMEVVVVDNGSEDGTADAAGAFIGVRVIRNTANRGAGAARNQGMAAAGSELLLLMDCDSYVTDDVIGRAVDEMRNSPDVSVLAPELRFPTGRRQYNAHRAMSIRLTLLRDLWLYRFIPRERRASTLLGGYYDAVDDAEPDWLAAPFIMLRRRVLLKCGGFDERLFPEDSEWGIRVSRAGHRILYAPRLGFVVHTGSTGAEQDRAAVLRLHHRAGLRAYGQLNGRLRAAGYWCAELVGSGVRACVYWAATRARPSNSFYASQLETYRTLVSIYVDIARGR